MRPAAVARAVRTVSFAALGLYLVLQVCAHTVAVLGEAGLSIVSACLPGVGSGAWWATHLAMVRADGACPEGTLLLGGAPVDVAVVVATVAVPALLAHLGLAVVSCGLLAAVRTSLRTLRTVVARVLHLPSAARTAAPLGRAPRVPGAAPPRPRPRLGGHVPVRRGPPASLRAA